MSANSLQILNWSIMNIEIVVSKDMQPYLGTVSMFRSKYFREFPYLYSIETEYENDYIQSFYHADRAVLFLLKDGSEVVGFSTGRPLLAKTAFIPNVEENFNKVGLDPSEYFYIGETIIDTKYRGKKYYSTIVSTRENYAIDKGYKALCFLAVERDINDARKPQGYKNNSLIFARLGYIKSDISVSESWPTIQVDGSVKNQVNTLYFWLKSLV